MQAHFSTESKNAFPTQTKTLKMRKRRALCWKNSSKPFPWRKNIPCLRVSPNAAIACYYAAITTERLTVFSFVTYRAEFTISKIPIISLDF